MKSGFTLIEMMVSLAIAAILAQLAIPGFAMTIKRYQISAIKDELEASIYLGRAEAVRRGVPVILRRTIDCGKTIAGNDDWSCGWEMFVDENLNGHWSEGEHILQAYLLPQNYSLKHPALSNQAASLVLNIWGQFAVVAHKFVISAADSPSAVTTTSLCINRGGRMRTVIGSSTCT